MVQNEIREILKKTCRALNKNGVEYIVIGGTAVAFHGYQRISGAGLGNPDLKYDIDFWYNPTTQNYYNLIKGLKELGVETSRLEDVIFDPYKTYLRIPLETFRMEFLPQMMGLSSFSESFSSSTIINLDGNDLHIINYNDLIKNKKAVNREIDKSDIKELQKRKKK